MRILSTFEQVQMHCISVWFDSYRIVDCTYALILSCRFKRPHLITHTCRSVLVWVYISFCVFNSTALLVPWYSEVKRIFHSFNSICSPLNLIQLRSQRFTVFLVEYIRVSIFPVIFLLGRRLDQILCLIIFNLNVTFAFKFSH